MLLTSHVEVNLADYGDMDLCSMAGRLITSKALEELHNGCIGHASGDFCSLWHSKALYMASGPVD